MSTYILSPEEEADVRKYLSYIPRSDLVSFAEVLGKFLERGEDYYLSGSCLLIEDLAFIETGQSLAAAKDLRIAYAIHSNANSNSYGFKDLEDWEKMTYETKQAIRFSRLHQFFLFVQSYLAQRKAP